MKKIFCLLSLAFLGMSVLCGICLSGLWIIDIVKKGASIKESFKQSLREYVVD